MFEAEATAMEEDMMKFGGIVNNLWTILSNSHQINFRQAKVGQGRQVRSNHVARSWSIHSSRHSKRRRADSGRHWRHHWRHRVAIERNELNELLWTWKHDGTLAARPSINCVPKKRGKKKMLRQSRQRVGVLLCYSEGSAFSNDIL